MLEVLTTGCFCHALKCSRLNVLPTDTLSNVNDFVKMAYNKGDIITLQSPKVWEGNRRKVALDCDVALQDVVVWHNKKKRKVPKKYVIEYTSKDDTVAGMSEDDSRSDPDDHVPGEVVTSAAGNDDTGEPHEPQGKGAPPADTSAADNNDTGEPHTGEPHTGEPHTGEPHQVVGNNHDEPHEPQGGGAPPADASAAGNRSTGTPKSTPRRANRELASLKSPGGNGEWLKMIYRKGDKVTLKNLGGWTGEECVVAKTSGVGDVEFSVLYDGTKYDDTRKSWVIAYTPGGSGSGSVEAGNADNVDNTGNADDTDNPDGKSYPPPSLSCPCCFLPFLIVPCVCR